MHDLRTVLQRGPARDRARAEALRRPRSSATPGLDRYTARALPGNSVRHSRERGNPSIAHNRPSWMPAFAGMTITGFVESRLRGTAPRRAIRSTLRARDRPLTRRVRPALRLNQRGKLLNLGSGIH